MKNTGEAHGCKEDIYGMDAAATDQAISTADNGGAPMDIPVGEDDCQSLIDFEVVGQLRMRIGQEGVNELLEMMLEHIPQHLAGLHEAVQNGDRKAMCAISHTLKSSSGTLGLTALFDQCKALSEVSHQMPIIEAKYRVDTIEDVYRRTAAFLRQKHFGK